MSNNFLNRLLEETNSEDVIIESSGKGLYLDIPILRIKAEPQSATTFRKEGDKERRSSYTEVLELTNPGKIDLSGLKQDHHYKIIYHDSKEGEEQARIKKIVFCLPYFHDNNQTLGIVKLGAPVPIVTIEDTSKPSKDNTYFMSYPLFKYKKYALADRNTSEFWESLKGLVKKPFRVKEKTFDYYVPVSLCLHGMYVTCFLKLAYTTYKYLKEQGTSGFDARNPKQYRAGQYFLVSEIFVPAGANSNTFHLILEEKDSLEGHSEEILNSSLSELDSLITSKIMPFCEGFLDKILAGEESSQDNVTPQEIKPVLDDEVPF